MWVDAGHDVDTAVGASRAAMSKLSWIHAGRADVGKESHDMVSGKLNGKLSFVPRTAQQNAGLQARIRQE